MSDIKLQINRLTAEYIQEPDDQDEINLGGIQSITITAEPILIGLWSEDNKDKIPSLKEDHYFSIKTERWAFDDEEELLKMFRDFKRRV